MAIRWVFWFLQDPFQRISAQLFQPLNIAQVILIQTVRGRRYLNRQARVGEANL
jgi:hypothetical protein